MFLKSTLKLGREADFETTWVMIGFKANQVKEPDVVEREQGWCVVSRVLRRQAAELPSKSRGLGRADHCDVLAASFGAATLSGTDTEALQQLEDALFADLKLICKVNDSNWILGHSG